MTISATTRFSKMCTAPTQEHDFQGSNLSKSVHFGTLFSLCFPTFCRLPPEHHFGASCADLVPKSLIFGPPLEPTGLQNSTQNGPRAPKNSAESAPRAPKVIFGILGSYTREIPPMGRPPGETPPRENRKTPSPGRPPGETPPRRTGKPTPRADPPGDPPWENPGETPREELLSF